MRYVYLHGFASGPQSRKAQAFRTAMLDRGADLEIPDLAEGDFEHLTVSGQLRVIERTLAGQPARLIGSSMGGYLAALYAASHPETERMVLLAPAFGFASRWQDMIGPERLKDWRDSGVLEVFHYGFRENRQLRYDLFEDARRYPANPDFLQKALIFHGIHDVTVPVEASRSFAGQHANAELRELESDHELLNVLSEITDAGIDYLLA